MDLQLTIFHKVHDPHVIKISSEEHTVMEFSELICSSLEANKWVSFGDSSAGYIRKVDDIIHIKVERL